VETLSKLSGGITELNYGVDNEILAICVTKCEVDLVIISFNWLST
jgi:hypothetical protein